MIPHRVPSPREIVMHTQTIMQNALIKKKLEEQRENFRKRQDQQQQQQQQQQVQQQQLRASSPVINSPAKQTASPLAFTPTSVLRKMTADKEPDGANQFRKLETTFSIIPAINGNINHSRMSRDQNNHRVHTAVPFVDSSKFSNSVNQVQNETLKMIFLQSAIANHINNNTCTEESALKTKHLCSLQSEKDIKDNPDINTTKENVFLDNENANDNSKVPESNVIDIDNDTNNNDCVSFHEAIKKSSELETLVNENNQMTASTASDGIENINS